MLTIIVIMLLVVLAYVGLLCLVLATLVSASRAGKRWAEMVEAEYVWTDHDSAIVEDNVRRNRMIREAEALDNDDDAL